MSSLAASSSSKYSIIQDSLTSAGGHSASKIYQMDASLGEVGGRIQSANGHLLVWAGDLAFLTTPNSVPVPRNLFFERPFGAGIRISISKLTQAAHDPDGDLLELAEFDRVTSSGAKVQKDSYWLVYQPIEGNNDSDSFNFTIADRQGGIAVGTVFVSVRPEEQTPTQNITSVVVGEEDVIVRFVGIPGAEYQIESTDSLTNPQWQLLAVAIAGTNGRFELRDTRSPGPTRFYRALFVHSE